MIKWFEYENQLSIWKSIIKPILVTIAEPWTVDRSENNIFLQIMLVRCTDPVNFIYTYNDACAYSLDDRNLQI